MGEMVVMLLRVAATLLMLRIIGIHMRRSLNVPEDYQGGTWALDLYTLAAGMALEAGIAIGTIGDTGANGGAETGGAIAVALQLGAIAWGGRLLTEHARKAIAQQGNRDENPEIIVIEAVVPHTERMSRSGGSEGAAEERRAQSFETWVGGTAVAWGFAIGLLTAFASRGWSGGSEGGPTVGAGVAAGVVAAAVVLAGHAGLRAERSHGAAREAAGRTRREKEG